MANLPESDGWIDGVYQLETSDPVQGGPNGVSNRASKALSSRTVWLKGQIEALLNGTLAAFKATRLATARKFIFSGAAIGNASFDGTADANIALTLVDSGVNAGTYPKISVSAKGLVISGAALSAADIPGLTWSKITSGRPTTLEGYGIDNAIPTGYTSKRPQLYAPAAGRGLTGGALEIREAELAAANATDFNYAPRIMFHWGGKIVCDLSMNVNGDIFWGANLFWHGGNFDPNSKANKATTLAGYSIADAYTQAQALAAINNAIFVFSTGVPQGVSFINGFTDNNSSRFWKANGNVYVSLDFARWMVPPLQTICFNLPPGYRPKVRTSGTGNWSTSNPFALGFFSWRCEVTGDVIIDYNVGSTAGGGGYIAQLNFCTQLA